MVDIDRRQFLKTGAMTIVVTSTSLCGLSGCATFTKIGDTAAISPNAYKRDSRDLIIDLSKEPVLSQVGGAVKIKDIGDPSGIIIAHTQENSFEIVSLHCTHRGVELEYDHKKQRFECASLAHSTYTLDGKNTGGPAKEPLKTYEATMEGSILTIKDVTSGA